MSNRFSGDRRLVGGFTYGPPGPERTPPKVIDTAHDDAYRRRQREKYARGGLADRRLLDAVGFLPPEAAIEYERKRDRLSLLFIEERIERTEYDARLQIFERAALDRVAAVKRTGLAPTGDWYLFDPDAESDANTP